MNAAAVFVLLALLGQETIPFAEYRERLGGIRSAIDASDLEAARKKARELQALRVSHEGKEFAADASVLKPVVDAKDLEAAREAARPLRMLSEALDSLPPGKSLPPDASLLDELRREEAERMLNPGGAVAGPQLHAPKVPNSLMDWLRDMAREIWDFLKRVLKKFLAWLTRMLFGGWAAGQSGSGMTWMVMALMVAILAIIGTVAFVTLKRRRRTTGAAAVDPAPVRAEKDEDPLSRSSNEWERFAAELMKAGRFREAIRAWYHAVLVTLFRSGLLHYRKDRTNWEYAYALSPEVPWRPGFVDATRTFEQIWYGRRDTPPETVDAYAAEARGLLEKVRGRRAP